MTRLKPWIETGDFALHWGGPCGSPTLVVSAAHEANHCIPLTNGKKPESKANHAVKIGIHLHAFYVEACAEVLEILRHSTPHARLLITTDSEQKKAYLNELLKQHQDSTSPVEWKPQVIVVPNHGRNVLPLLREGWPRLRSCEAVLHIHTKRTPHQSFGEVWSRELIDSLAGSAAQVNAVASAFEADSHLGMVIPKPFEDIRPFLNWGANFELACWISQTLWPQHQLSIEAPLVFPAGMMFWFRPQALEPLIAAEALLQVPPQEPLLEDGTSLHALERLTLHACEVAGFDWRYIGVQQGLASQTPVDRQYLSVWAPQPEAYRAGVAALSHEHRKLVQEHRKLVQEHGELQNQLAQLKEHQAAQAADLAGCLQVKSNLETELWSMRQSLSWRLMGPARRLARLLRRFAA